MSSTNEINDEYEQVELFGRVFCFRKNGPSYLFPLDFSIEEPTDIWQEFFLRLRKDRPWSAPVPTDRPGLRIVDLGCGTGTWTLDTVFRLAKMNEETDAQITGLDQLFMGIDIFNRFPLEIPVNVCFEVMDANGPWPDGGDEYTDLLYIRRMAGSIKSWPELYAKSLKMLKPNDGWLEHIEIDFEPRCDDKPVPPQLRSIFDEFLSALDENGFSMRINSDVMKNGLQAAGFVDIKEELLQIPVSEWSGEGKFDEFSRWMQLAVTKDLRTLFLGPLSRVKRRSEEEIENYIKTAKHELCELENRVYMKVYTWTARRPGP